MEPPGQDHTIAIHATDKDSNARRFLAMVFLWMFTGLAVTSACIYAFNTYDYCMRLISNSNGFTGLLWLALIGPFVVSFIIRRGINAISFFGLGILFILYAALIGVCFSFILLDFVDASLFGIFLTACLVFGAMAVAGYATKIDLTQFKPISYMLLGGLVIVTLIVFIFSDFDLTLVDGIIGVIIFLGISAFHFQGIKETGAAIDLNDPSAKKMALLNALTMYVDFVNLFFFIIAIFFNRKR